LISIVPLWAFLLVLPLPGVKTKSVSQKDVVGIVSNLLQQNVTGIVATGRTITLNVKPQNTCALPFSKPTCMLTRFAKKVDINPRTIVGPFTGHLAINRVISLSMLFDGAPVSRNSAAAIIFMASPFGKHVTTGYTIIGQDINTPIIRYVPMKCRGVYAVDMLYSGMDPALGRVWHRSVISGMAGKAKALFTTGGFAMGPAAAFSIGTGYWWEQPFEHKVHLSAWQFNGCNMVSTGLDLALNRPVNVEITRMDLENQTQKPLKISIKTPFDLKALKTGNPMAVLGWALVAGRMLRVLPNPVLWVSFRSCLVFIMYSITEMPVDSSRIMALWSAAG